MPTFRYAPVAAVVLAFIAAAIVVRVAHAAIHRLTNALDIVGSEDHAVVHARAKQLIRALTFLAYGVAALAIGFGAQNLVRDVISGFFLILEDQVRIGDLARINGVGGIVEQINLRTILLRDAEGAVHVFPNGTITSLANLSKQYANAVVDIKVSYNENLDRVMGTIREVGASMQHDATWGSLVVGPLDIIGIDSLEGGAANIKVKFRTLPLNQGKVANELRRRLMDTFVVHGI